ncbi:MAG: GNAT family N-acetyltransferase [Pseudomonadota bacterium]
MAETADDIEGEVIYARLRSGRNICIRTISRDDRDLMRTGIEAMSPQSRYLRFFSAAPTPPKVVIDRLLDTEGDHHLAWGAIDMDRPDRPAIGAVHVIQQDPSEPYEFSVAVLDAYQSEGLGTLLTAAILVNCKASGIKTLFAHALMENSSAIGLLSTFGAELADHHGATAEYRLVVDRALRELQKLEHIPSLGAVIERLEKHY